MFLPATQMLPRVGSSSFSRRRMNVDLPEPVGPTINTNSPLPISTDTLSRATTLSLYVFVTFSVLIMGKEGGRTARMLPDGAGQSNQLATRRLRELLQELPGALGYTRAADAVLLVQFLGRTGLPEGPGPEDQQRSAPVSHGQDLGDRASQTADRTVVLYRHQGTAIGSRPEHGLFIEGLQRVDVDDPRGDAVLGQRVRGLHRFLNRGPGAEDAHVGSLPHLRRLPELESIPLRVHVVDLLPGEPEEHGPHMVDQVLHGSLGLHGVARIDDRHVRQCPEAGDVLQGHLRVPVLTDADARMGPHDAHVGFLVRDGDPERLDPPGDEARERGRPRNLPRQRQTGGDPQHVSFGDADVDEPLRELLRELLGASRVPEISG